MSEKLEFIVQAKDQFSGAFDKLTGYLPTVKNLAIGAAGGVAALGTGLFAMTKSTADSYDKVQKLSDQLGISTSFLSKYGVAADFSGVAQETFNKSIQKLQVGMGEAARGMGAGKEAFESLGISVADSAGKLKTAETVIPELADALHNVESATERAELASKLFGQRGIEMLQMFTGGKEGLAEMTAEAEKFGLVVSDKAGRNAAMFGDSLGRVAGAFRGIKNHIAEVFMPTFTGMANRMADFIADNREAIVQFAERFLVAMGSVAEKGAWGVAVLVDAWSGLQMTWEILKIGFAEFSEVLWKGIDFLIGKFQAMIEAVNIRGIFDNDIAQLARWSEAAGGAISEMTRMSVESRDRLQELADKGLATDKVDEYSEKIRTAIAEIQAAGAAPEGEESAGMHPFSDANLEKTAENMEVLQEMWDEYMLDDLEKLDLWFAAQQEKYKGNWVAQEKLMAIYTKRMSGLKKTADKEDVASEDWKQMAIGGIRKVGTIKGFDLTKAAMLPEIKASTQTGAIKAYQAMAGIPFIGPALGAAAAAAVIAYGGARLGITQALGLNIAHGGLDYVPKEQTYLLDRGERVLSPNQNRDVTDFIKSGGGGGVTINSPVFNLFTPQPVENMTRNDWIDLAQDEIIPALTYLSGKGIRI
jgi:hypothetical protein